MCGESTDAQDPPLAPCSSSLTRCEWWIEISRKRAQAIHLCQPSTHTVGVLLVNGPRAPIISVTGEARIHFSDHRSARRNFPTVERPTMHSIAKLFSQPIEPWQTGMRRLGDLSLHIKLEYRFRRGCPPLSKSELRGHSNSFTATPLLLTDDLYRLLRFIGRPGIHKIN